MDQPSSYWPTLTIAVGSIAWLAAVRFRRGAILAPFSLTVLMLVSIFGVRPLLMLRFDTYDVYGLDVVTGFNMAAVAGFVATIALSVAYWFSRVTDANPSAAAMAVQVAPGWRPPPFGRAVAVCIGTVALWFAAIVVIGGGPSAVALLFRGRSQAAAATLGHTPAAVFCIPIAGAVLVAASRVTTERLRRLTAHERLLFWAAVIASTIPAASLGVRRFILPSLLIGLVAVVLPRWSRPVTARMLGFGTGSLLILAAIPFIRSAGARRDGQGFVHALVDYFSVTSVAETLKALFLTYDTDSFGYVSYFAPRLGDGIPYGAGRSTVGDLVVNSLPVSFGELWSDHLLRLTFGTGCADGVCPVASIVGILLFDAGLPAVVGGCLLLGWFFGRFEKHLVTAGGHRLLTLLVVAGFTPVFVRGSSMNTAWLGLNVLLSASGLLWVFGSKPAPAEVDEPARISAK